MFYLREVPLYTILFNRPQEIDEAARRRLVKRLYIPLPDPEARKQIICNLMKGQPFSVTDEEMEKIKEQTKGTLQKVCIFQILPIKFT